MKTEKPLKKFFFAALMAVFIQYLGVCCWGQKNPPVKQHIFFDINPRGNDIVFNSIEGGLYLFDYKSLVVKTLSKSQSIHLTPAFSPDGKSVAFASRSSANGNAKIFVYDLANNMVKKITTGNKTNDHSPAFSQDGKQIVFVRAHWHRPYSMGGWKWDNNDIYVVNRDGTGLRRITQENCYNMLSPHFMEQDTRILFAADDDTFRLLSVDVDGETKPQNWSVPSPKDYDAGAWGSKPSLSLDQQSVVFISDRKVPFQYDIWVADTTGDNLRHLNIPLENHHNSNPVFVPNEKKILFLAATDWDETQNPIFSLWQVDADSKNAHQIADSKLFTAPSKWRRPCSKRLP